VAVNARFLSFVVGAASMVAVQERYWIVLVLGLVLGAWLVLDRGIE
jgi:hypothetical protein